MNEFYQQIRDQVTRIWENLSVQQKVLFLAAPVMLLLAMVFAVYLASRPQMVTLVTLDNPAQLQRIVQQLETDNIDYEIPNERTVMVDKSMKARASMKLAGEGLIGADTGVGWSLFDQTRLGMTDNTFNVQKKRALQDELERTIIDGADNITDARVHITFAEPSLFKEDAVTPTASVKITSRGTVSKSQVTGIQNLVAGAIPKLDPEKVIILGSNNNLLSESTSVEAGVGEKTKQIEVQLTVEDILRRKIEDALHTLVGPEQYNVKVTAVLDWQKERSEQIDIQNDSPAPLSEKTYEEENSSPSISGPPGVDSNVQTEDTGIGGQTTTNSSISETITNYQYPWTKIMKENPTGVVTEISVAVALNYVEDVDTGERVQRSPEQIDALKQLLRTAVNLPAQDPPDAALMSKFTLVEFPFDDSQARLMAREKLWENITSIVKTMLPLVLLFALGYFVYIFFQSAFAPPEIEMEEEEEIPIEPVTEAKELTLSQLGLAEFGDIASLPAEEQRRLKMQEHVINYAAEKPEEVAAIIKAWLSG